MSNKKQKQCTTMEEHHASLHYRNNEDFFDDINYEVSSVLLDLSHHVVDFSSDSTSLPKWGFTRKRINTGSLKPQEISPVTKPPLCTEVKELGSSSSSSSSTVEAKKTNPQTIIRNVEGEFSTEKSRLEMQMNSSQPNSVSKPEMSLTGTQVGLLDDQNVEPLISVDKMAYARAVEAALRQAWENMQRSSLDLNIPAVPEEGCENNGVGTSESLEKAETKVQAAQARQRRLGLIRSKKVYKNMFISPYQ